MVSLGLNIQQSGGVSLIAFFPTQVPKQVPERYPKRIDIPIVDCAKTTNKPITCRPILYSSMDSFPPPQMRVDLVTRALSNCGGFWLYAGFPVVQAVNVS